MKIALLGYGKMGKAIEELAIERGHEIILRATSTTPIDIDLLRKAHVAIEFSRPDTAVRNINLCFDHRIPIVVGTTGWQDDITYILNRCLDEGQSIFHASNFSIGINIFNEVSKKLTHLISQYPAYKSSIVETHHEQKLDKPSGTAILLAEGIVENHKELSKWGLDEEGDDILSIHSIREGQVPGTHTIKYDSEIDCICMTHEAKSRKGFALGAIMAAEFLPGKIGSYSMNDLINLNI